MFGEVILADESATYAQEYNRTRIRSKCVRFVHAYSRFVKKQKKIHFIQVENPVEL